MHIEIERSNLMLGTQFTSSIIDTKQAGNHQLANILLDAEGDCLRVVASNLNITLTRVIDEVSIEVPGKFAIPGRTLAGAVGATPKSSMVLETFENRLRVRAGRAEFDLRAMAGADYEGVLPPADRGEFVDDPLAEVSVPVDEFRPALAAAATTMAPQRDYRHHLQAVLFEVASERFRLVSTDMSRMCVATMHTDNKEPDPSATALVGRRTISEINRLLMTTEEDCLDVTLRSNGIIVKDGSHTIRSNVVNQSYPAYEHGIPKEGCPIMVADRAALKEAVKQATLTALTVDRMVRFDCSDNALKVSSHNEYGHRFQTELPVQYDSKLAVGFNGDMLYEILDNLSGDDVHLH
ncbi:MAG: hypothetical protein J4F97_05760, partial [Pseudomonadales bacterium]|nr:hypothetical protein [Pseudomonadales bacterium]